MKNEIYLDSILSSHELAASFMNSSTSLAAVKRTLYTIYLIRKLDHLQIFNLLKQGINFPRMGTQIQ